MTNATRRANLKIWRGSAALGLVALISAMAMLSAPITSKNGRFGPFERALNTTDHGYQIVPDPTELAPTRHVERFEVRNGDCVKKGAWDECAQDRERSELAQTKRNIGEGETLWYGWSFYLPPDFPDVWPTKTTLAQFHQTDQTGRSTQPVWMLLMHPFGLVLDDQTTGLTSRVITLIPDANVRDRWHKVEIRSKWAKDETGTFDVWINGEQVFTHKGPTMTADTVYFRYGVYRSFVSRYKSAKAADMVPTQIAYFTNVKRARSRKGLH